MHIILYPVTEDNNIKIITIKEHIIIKIIL